MPSDPAFLRRMAAGVTIDLRAQPGARRRVVEVTPQGALKAAVTAPPEDGKANAAIIALLAEAWRLPPSGFDVVRGAGARNKTLRIAGDPAVLANRIGEWMRKHD